MGLQSATPTLTSSTLGAGYQDLSFHVKQELKNCFPQVEQGEDDLADDHRQRVGQDVLLLLVRCLWRWGHHQPQDLQVRKC